VLRSHRLGSASEYDPRFRAPSCMLSRGSLPPQRNPAVEIHHSRAFACPGHVASSRLPCASTPCSLDGLPRISFNEVRSRGFYPSELDLAAVAALLSVHSPSCDRPCRTFFNVPDMHGYRCLEHEPRGGLASGVVLQAGWDRRAQSSPLFDGPGSLGLPQPGLSPSVRRPPRSLMGSMVGPRVAQSRRRGRHVRRSSTFGHLQCT